MHIRKQSDEGMMKEVLLMMMMLIVMMAKDAEMLHVRKQIGRRSRKRMLCFATV